MKTMISNIEQINKEGKISQMIEKDVGCSYGLHCKRERKSKNGKRRWYVFIFPQTCLCCCFYVWEKINTNFFKRENANTVHEVHSDQRHETWPLVIRE